MKKETRTQYTIELHTGESLKIEYRDGVLVMTTTPTAALNHGGYMTLPMNLDNLIELHDVVNEIERSVIGE